MIKQTSPNRAYLTVVLHAFAQIQAYVWTSDTLGTLDETIVSVGKLVYKVIYHGIFPNFSFKQNKFRFTQ